MNQGRLKERIAELEAEMRALALELGVAQAHRDELLKALKGVLPVRPDKTCPECFGNCFIYTPGAVPGGIVASEPCPDCNGTGRIWSDAADFAAEVIESVQKGGV